MSTDTTVPGAGFNQLRWIALWAIGRLSKAAESGVTTDRDVALAIRLGKKYDRDKGAQRSLRAAIDVLLQDGLARAGSAAGLARYTSLGVTPEGAAKIVAIESAFLGRDLLFLTDLLGMAKANRLVNAHLLDQAARSGAVPEGLDRQRYHKILRVKLFQEFVLGVEEVGALCFAVRERGDNGILFQYLNYDVKDIATFYREVLGNVFAPLDVLLALPSRGEIKARVASDEAERIFLFFEVYGNWLRQGADVYVENEKAAVRAMNKAKHGFTVVNDPALIGSRGPHGIDEVTILIGNTWEDGDAGPEWSFDYTPLFITDEERDRDLQLLKSMYEVQGELISILCRLFGNGVDLACYQP